MTNQARPTSGVVLPMMIPSGNLTRPKLSMSAVMVKDVAPYRSTARYRVER